MFKNFKSQFIWCILCTFITGLITGAIITLIEYKEFNIMLILMLLDIGAIIFNVVFWKTIFNRLYLQDKINSIWNHD